MIALAEHPGLDYHFCQRQLNHWTSTGLAGADTSTAVTSCLTSWRGARPPFVVEALPAIFPPPSPNHHWKAEMM